MTIESAFLHNQSAFYAAHQCPSMIDPMILLCPACLIMSLTKTGFRWDSIQGPSNETAKQYVNMQIA
jgi:hypothetical protein